MTPLDRKKCLDIARGCACFHLRRTARLVTQAFDQKLKASGLKVTQFSLLMAAFLMPEAKLGKMAKVMGMDRTTLSRNLQLLQVKGLVALEPGEDRREHMVVLTDLGKDTLEQAIPFWEEAQEQVTKDLGDQDWAQVHAMLREMASKSGG